MTKREWASDCFLMPIQQFFNYIMARTSASLLKQQSAGRHVAPHEHIILIPSQSVFALSP